MAENLPTPNGQLPVNPTLPNNSPPTNQPPKPQQQPFRRMTGKPKKGDLIGFRYTFWKHDPHPLVLVTSVYNDGRVAGINLHNLTLWDMKNLVSQYCNKSTISYQTAVKGRREILKGFRTYKWEGIRDIMVMDCQNFLNRLGIVREKKLLSPNEIEKLRLQLQQQMKRQVNPKANTLTQHIQQQTNKATVAPTPGKPASVPGTPIGGQQGGN